MAQPIWITPAGDLGTIGEGEFFKQTLAAEDPEGGTLSFQLIAGSLPTGVQVKSNGILEGVPLNKIFVQGVPLNVAEDVTSRFAIRATSTNGSGVSRINDRTFEITVTGADSPEFVTPAGRIGTFFDGTQAEIQIQATDADPGDTLTFSLNAGSLPPGLSLNSTTGLISGIILPLTGPPGSAVPGFDSVRIRSISI
jgi:large repetitive protein